MRHFILLTVILPILTSSLNAQPSASDFRNLVDRAYYLQVQAIDAMEAGGADVQIAMNVIAINGMLMGILTTNAVATEFLEIVRCSEDRENVVAYAESKRQPALVMAESILTGMRSLRAMGPRTSEVRALLGELEAVAEAMTLLLA